MHYYIFDKSYMTFRGWHKKVTRDISLVVLVLQVWSFFIRFFLFKSEFYDLNYFSNAIRNTSHNYMLFMEETYPSMART